MGRRAERSIHPDSSFCLIATDTWCLHQIIRDNKKDHPIRVARRSHVFRTICARGFRLDSVVQFFDVTVNFLAVIDKVLNAIEFFLS